MSDGRRLPDPLAIVPALPRGAALCLRHYGHPDRRGLAMELADALRIRGMPLIVAGDVRLAIEAKAWGFHLPGHMLAGHRIDISLARSHRLAVTAAVHEGASAMRARQVADAVLISPVFATASHPGAPALGAIGFEMLAGTAQRPAYALGGVSPATVRRLRMTRAAGIAGIGFAAR